MNLSNEGLLWKTAISHYGAESLEHIVVRMLQAFEPRPSSGALAYLQSRWVSMEVVGVLKRAQAVAGTDMPFFDEESNRVAILACYSDHLADRLLQLLPPNVLPMSLKGLRLERDMGL